MRVLLLAAVAGSAVVMIAACGRTPQASRLRPREDSTFVRANCVAADSVLAGTAACVLRDQRPSNVRIF